MGRARRSGPGSPHGGRAVGRGLGRAGRATALTVLTCLVSTLLVAVPVATAEAEVVSLQGATTLTVDGRGYGHGRGMSQNGAQGAALQGLGHRDILGTYYPGTTVHDVGDPVLRVRVTGSTRRDGAGPLVRASGSLVAVDDLVTGRVTTLPGGTTQCVARPSGTAGTELSCTGAQPTTVRSTGQVRVRAGATGVGVQTGSGTTKFFRGALVVVRDGSQPVAVVHTAMQEYLRGVVPLEMPPGWHAEALRAQSVAARTYALRSVLDAPRGRTYDVCDTTACQVFSGMRTVTGTSTTVHEHPATDAAVAATRGTTLRHGGVPAFTQFSASNGGWSVASPSHPYLVARSDPFDGRTGSTSHRWTTSVPVSRIASSWPRIGTPTGIAVLSRDGNGEWGGRALTVRVTGSAGSVDVTGEQLRSALGLRSSWVLLRTDVPTGARNPVGSLDPLVAQPGGALVRGWAADPDSGASVLVRITVDGAQVHAVTADRPRPDVGAAFPSYGGSRGFEAQVALTTPGPHRVCAEAINVGAGTGDTSLGCRDVSVGADPRGSLDPLEGVLAGVRAKGWAWDPDSTAPTEVHLWLDGRPARSVLADVERPDVARAVPGAGPARGYDEVLPATGGRHRLCAYGINTGVGTNTLLGCRDVDVPSSPGGRLEQASPARAAVDLVGWAVDPDTTAPVEVHSYVSGRASRTVADLQRTDLPAHVAATGAARGFAYRAHAMGGSQRVCSYGVNLGAGSSSLLGCLPFVVDSTPFGHLDSVVRSTGGVVVSGWAIDPDVAAPVSVHVYADGRYAGRTTAAATRGDVAAVHPLHGASHGYRLVVPAAARPAQVCAYAIDVPNPDGTTRDNPLLGCRQG